uniref:Zinc-finger domain-containing protein n=1 Tax=Cannabis sativa TaxID=3483 RepID=A0A803P7V4_CANSA
MGRFSAKIDYEDLRNARILENQARLKTIGLQKTISELRSIVSSSKPAKRPWTKKVYDLSSLRRSRRLKRSSSSDLTPIQIQSSLRRRSSRLSSDIIQLDSAGELFDDESEDERTVGGKIRPANMPWVKIKGSGAALQLSPEASALRCSSRGRGGVYNSVVGICCHFCRQKKLCGEEDCKRCGNLDVDEPCIGKTDCSVCHSSNGVLCRACLKVRYGEEMEEVRENKEWMCPHCIEEKGINQYWICNSSICLKRRKMAPTGIAIYTAKELGYKSVAHLVMDKLKGTIKG